MTHWRLEGDAGNPARNPGMEEVPKMAGKWRSLPREGSTPARPRPTAVAMTAPAYPPGVQRPEFRGIKDVDGAGSTSRCPPS
ncbi:Hypothetical protein NTJ_01767 [Nesidiocoris tenuis]|uniref:Uncharacterized protein n=1 Tax=Nesidiocoris tenuis TaxID=355587 RepID=A0ABN7A9H1_9HEMI|nr:Hypothetical protein NTJ_01767 [Nesidiocoris tenuis]